MNENKIRKSIQEAIKNIDKQTKEKVEEVTYVPKDKEHLQENKKLLNEELIKRWGFQKKKV